MANDYKDFEDEYMLGAARMIEAAERGYRTPSLYPRRELGAISLAIFFAEVSWAEKSEWSSSCGDCTSGVGGRPRRQVTGLEAVGKDLCAKPLGPQLEAGVRVAGVEEDSAAGRRELPRAGPKRVVPVGAAHSRPPNGLNRPGSELVRLSPTSSGSRASQAAHQGPQRRNVATVLVAQPGDLFLVHDDPLGQQAKLAVKLLDEGLGPVKPPLHLLHLMVRRSRRRLIVTIRARHCTFP